MTEAQPRQERRIYFSHSPQCPLLSNAYAMKPYQLANQVAGRKLYDCETVSAAGTIMTASCGSQIVTDKLPKLSPGDLMFVCGGRVPLLQEPALATWLAYGWRHGATAGSVCTGAYSLARAGVLFGREFILHWENIDAFIENFPHLTPSVTYFSIHNRVIASGGGISSAELMLHLLEPERGRALTAQLSDMMLYPTPWYGDVGVRLQAAQALDSGHPALVEAVQSIEGNADKDRTPGAVAKQVDRSWRQLERLFRRHLGVTPSSFIADCRVDRACILKKDTRLSLTDVAYAAGCPSDMAFRKHYRRRFGRSPKVPQLV